MSLRSYSLNTTARPLEFFIDPAPGDSRFDLDQPYQRGIAWGRTRNQNLIKSLLIGVPIPAILLNNRLDAGFNHPGYDQNRNWSYAVVDGKQRVTAVQGFLAGRFAVPREWFDEPGSGDIFFNDLAQVRQNFFRNTPLPVVEGRFATLAEEQQLFDLINFGGLAQGEVDDDLQLG